MITVTLDETGPQPLYEQLYRHMRRLIERGELATGARLPSKRKMADHLRVSLRTIENAYAQLTVEGYIEAVEKKAFFVRALEGFSPPPVVIDPSPISSVLPKADICRFDLKTNKMSVDGFPFASWTRLMRESLRDRDTDWLEPSHPQGNLALRHEIVTYLRQFRSMAVSADQVILGAGTEYLIGLLTELMPDAVFALENPNYHKPAKILRSRRAEFVSIPMDEEGLSIDALRGSRASVVLAAPSHHFPLGTVMTVSRRLQLLRWAAERDGRYLVEDDYDSEFRFALKPVPALHSLDRSEKVIYMNTFTRTLAPSLRVAYLVLPRRLLARYREMLSFYACTVSAFEQTTLQRFIARGHYERHLNRIRILNRGRRDALLTGLSPLGDHFEIRGQEAGLHLLVTAPHSLSEAELVTRAQGVGVRLYGLSGYYLDSPPETHTVILGYAGYSVTELQQIAALLVRAWR